jgi:hypothetical protein
MKGQVVKRGLILLVLIAAPAWSQTTTTGPANTKGDCSPAVTGSNNTLTLNNCNTEKRPPPPAVIPLSVTIEQVESSSEPDKMSSHYYTRDVAAPDNKTQYILIPIDIALVIRIMNIDANPVNVEKYSLEFKHRKDGKWISLCKAGSPPDDVFTVLGNFSRAYRLDVDRLELNHLITFRTLKLGDPAIRLCEVQKAPAYSQSKAVWSVHGAGRRIALPGSRHSTDLSG